MHEVIFDIETNAITDWDGLSDLEVVHCIALAEGQGKVELYSDSYCEGFLIADALKILERADRLIGHNINRFDIRALKRLYPKFNVSNCHVIDTVLAAKIMDPDVGRHDFRNKDMPSKLKGRHSLEAWGWRLGVLKGDYGKQTDWSEFTEEMGLYCVQDVKVTQELWRAISQTFNEDVYLLEVDFQKVILEQEAVGVAFDENAAFKLHAELIEEKAKIEDQMQEIFPAQMEPMKTPEYYFDPDDGTRYAKKKDAPTKLHKRLVAGPPKVRFVPFNPGSRMQIANALKSMYGWKPTELTGDGRARVDEAVLSSLDYPEAKVLCRYLMITKRLGQLSDGKEAWIRLCKDGRIHGSMDTMGTVSSRCTHRRPNLAQVPNVGAPYGIRCRELFTATAGSVMVGCDMSGLELRCLAHYLAKWDGGEYARMIVEGDIHQFNAEKMGVSRTAGKGIMYATLYGAGNAKIGALVGGSSREGKRMRDMLERGIPALKRLKNAISARLQGHEWLHAIDGRRLPVRSEHAALNLLLQSCGSILMKKATVLMHESFRAAGLTVEQVMHVHDEVQFETLESEAEHVGRLAVQAMREAGESFEFRCPLDGEYRIGRNWAETH